MSSSRRRVQRTAALHLSFLAAMIGLVLVGILLLLHAAAEGSHAESTLLIGLLIAAPCALVVVARRERSGALLRLALFGFSGGIWSVASGALQLTAAPHALVTMASALVSLPPMLMAAFGLGLRPPHPAPDPRGRLAGAGARPGRGTPPPRAKGGD